MTGLDMNKPLEYKHASLRFFKMGEHHIDRLCRENVLLLVYDGVLRFTEDGEAYELHPGDYHIQRHDSVQSGPLPSDAPQYLYVHFLGTWTDSGPLLPRRGTFDYTALKPLMDELDRLAHSHAPYVVQATKLYELLSALYHTKPADTVAHRMAAYIAGHCQQLVRLEDLCDQFHFSKNHVITVFKREFGMTPIAYTNTVRLQKAEHLMEVTSDPLDSIAQQCGFHHYSYFYKLFYRKHQCSPEQWRQRKRIG